MCKCFQYIISNTFFSFAGSSISSYFTYRKVEARKGWVIYPVLPAKCVRPGSWPTPLDLPHLWFLITKWLLNDKFNHVSFLHTTPMASVSWSLDLTGGNWGLRKRQKDRHRESCNWVGPTLLKRDAGDPLCLQAHLLIQHVLKAGWNPG
jgi:hypothetical protein